MNTQKISWWLEFIRAIVAAAAGILGGLGGTVL